ncbi:GntR family transcriptional regulator [Planctomicrobium piriforme]|uniref:DNA-binding transcriptional regulator, LacI/PurR family n=1 Tax=Planctomicrobium piriforme TaxID=1576369 RepID=A0A1I3K888_9PLAN|nr:GntR family transcriptional regulator [Planctomicrobium piriforme]SFI68677.1 DNA-binding transcriptional regulator, LacI/PurR family [Planctomicrobium piriforme]
MSRQPATQIVDVAERILLDIRRRKLRAGDAYLGTAETAKLLRISGSTVNRAFQLLARRGVVERRQRRGTIVLDPQRKRPPNLQRVHLLVREDHLQAEGLWADGVLMGLQQELPGVELQFNFRPIADEAEYVQQVIDEMLRSRWAAGLVLIRTGVVTQRLVQASGLPAVVSGTLQPSISGLPSIDRDQAQIGKLLAEHLLKQRCRRFLILMRDRITAGDHLMLDAALQTLAAAGVVLDRVTLRFLPSDTEAIVAEVQKLLPQLGSALGCLCRSERLANGVLTAANATPFKVTRVPKIVVADVAQPDANTNRFPCIESSISPEDWGRRIGRLLLNAARGDVTSYQHEIVPVRIMESFESQIGLTQRR